MMNPFLNKLILELRTTRDEIESALQYKQKNDWLTVILEEELNDINEALQKAEDGNFGLCEVSGEFIPIDLLATIPTLKSLKDTDDIEIFYKKPISPSFL
ncbi:hypothetical protein [Neobacillus jeddahensis]|uniref:hypothetical protein n=1 Tax=Neobacillus jeddahensis TaxID=1461580 RepID=UPI000693F681|nr:hypothetical protein [Neobacillus jeddahensis]